MQALLPHRRERLARVKLAVLQNAEFLRAVAEPHYGNDPPDPRTVSVSGWNFEKVRSTLKQFVREWSSDGREERRLCIDPLVAELRQRLPVPDRTDPARPCVLVPGAGLGRLVWELAHAGYRTQGNEFSYFMLLASDHLLNRVEGTEAVTLYPYLQACNIFNGEDMIRPIRVPDVDMHTVPEGWDMSMVAGEFLEVYHHHVDRWDGMVTSFFLDTAHNVIEYVRVIHRMMKPGGVWVNMGPLLWHYEGMEGEASLELSFDEVREIIRQIGFTFVKEERIRTPYTDDSRSMMHVVYDTVLFVAIKNPVPAAAAPAPAVQVSDASTTEPPVQLPLVTPDLVPNFPAKLLSPVFRTTVAWRQDQNPLDLLTQQALAISNTSRIFLLLLLPTRLEPPAPRVPTTQDSDFSDQYEYNSATDQFEFSEATASRLRAQRRKLYKIKYPHGHPGSRKHTRYLNELLGADRDAPLDEDELVELLRDHYAPRSMFHLFYGEGKSAHERNRLWSMWAPLLSCTFEQQTVYLKELGVLPSDDVESSTGSSGDEVAKPGEEPRAVRRSRRRKQHHIYHITKPLRIVMKREPDPAFVESVEVEILGYLKNASEIINAARDANRARRHQERAAQRAAPAPAATAPSQPVPPEIEMGQEDEAEDAVPPPAFREEVPHIPALVLPATDAFHRLLVHGVAQYYNLQSNSEETPEGHVTRITGVCEELPPITVSEYLALRHQLLPLQPFLFRQKVESNKNT
ncbi:putative Carnosine N-methyltransferase [Paratrimastix pyriformis]|uniref:carnosine N-methyltransferase n=1 Tax=Paratrimastix pyriformis TaxID=342808 RepID=A0ABQ8UEG2_9EUKA|nr:putative Carnosine N-methyltransferase [Paratrimastix pyriformis]